MICDFDFLGLSPRRGGASGYPLQSPPAAEDFRFYPSGSAFYVFLPD